MTLLSILCKDLNPWHHIGADLKNQKSTWVASASIFSPSSHHRASARSACAIPFLRVAMSNVVMEHMVAHGSLRPSILPNSPKMVCKDFLEIIIWYDHPFPQCSPGPPNDLCHGTCLELAMTAMKHRMQQSQPFGRFFAGVHDSPYTTATSH